MDQEQVFSTQEVENVMDQATQQDTKEVAPQPEQSSGIYTENGTLTQESVNTLANMGYLPKNTPPEQVKMYADICRHLGLDPFKRQVYLIEYKSKNGGKTYSLQISQDGLLAMAHRTGEFAGVDNPEPISDKDGTLVAAKCTAYRFMQGEARPFTSKVLRKEYDQGNSIWKNKPFTMLGKVARVQALRLAFPDDTAGLYTTEEMPADDGGEGKREKAKQASRGKMKPSGK